MMEDKMINLKTRFPQAGEEAIESLLVQHHGHAGQVAARLKEDQSPHVLHDSADQRAELAKKDPASALLALLQAMQEHGQSQCKHGCTLRAKRLSRAAYFECVSPNVDDSPSQDDIQHPAAEGQCSVAASLNSELNMLVKLVKQFSAGKENDAPRECPNKQLAEHDCSTVAPECVNADSMQTGLRVRVVGAIGRGLEGTLRNYDDNQRRWSVVLDTGAAYYLRGSDLEPAATSQACCYSERSADSDVYRDDHGCSD
jgi:hypothetical protein